MTNAETIPKPTILDRVAEWWNTPAKIEADPTAHQFVYKGAGQILVRVNPARQARLDELGRALRDARNAKIAGADSLREQKLKEARARHAAELQAIEAEYLSTETVATAEFTQAEQALLAEFSARPVIEQGA